MTFLKEELPVFAACEDAVRRGPIPWEDPELPRLLGFYLTLKEVWLRPGVFFKDLDKDGWVEPLGFGLIVGTIGFLAFLYWKLLVGVGVSQQLAGMPMASQFFTLGVRAMLALMLLAPVIILVDLGLGAFGRWVGVALMGGAAPGFTAVMRVVCYAQAGLVAALLPFLGGPLALLGVLVLTYRGVKTGFGLSAGCALGALAISLALQVLCLMLFLGSLTGLLGLMGFWLLWG
jgi:hypothetical protein